MSVLDTTSEYAEPDDCDLPEMIATVESATVPLLGNAIQGSDRFPNVVFEVNGVPALGYCNDEGVIESCTLVNDCTSVEEPYSKVKHIRYKPFNPYNGEDASNDR